MQGTHKDVTEVWELYQRGKLYNNTLSPNQYNVVNTNIEFFIGNQWVNIPNNAAMSRLAKPVFNIIKRVTSLFVASLTSSAVSVDFEPLAFYDGTNIAEPDTNAADYATAEVQNLLEKFKWDYRIKDALFDGAITGDYCAHFYWDADALPYGGAFGPYRGEIQAELVDGINVMFGNPNTTNVDKQPYIIIVGRDTVQNLRFEAQRYRASKKEKEKVNNKQSGDAFEDTDVFDYGIQPDAEYMDMPGEGGKVEILPDDENGKALYFYYYTKATREEPIIDQQTMMPVMEDILDEDGNQVAELDDLGLPKLDEAGNPVFKQRPMTQLVTSVHVTKATRTEYIYRDVDTGLTRYPIAWGNWERQKNQYHGRALVTDIIPNQIFINTMFAMVMRHLQLLGFPKEVYNATLIKNWTNELGQAIGVRDMQPNQSIKDVAMALQPADMSTQIFQAIDKAVALTKECLGATDAQMGNVKPDNTSAIMVLHSNSAVPLENPRSCLHEWMEDIGAVLLDMMGTYYGERPIVRDREFTEPVAGPDGTPTLDPMTGLMATQTVTKRVIEKFDFSQFKHLWLNVRVDVGATTYFSEIAMVQTLDNLRRDGLLDWVDYLERMPDKLIPRKAELLTKLKAAAGQGGDLAPAIPAGRGSPTVGGPLDKAKSIATMPPGIQAVYNKLPSQAQRALMQQSTLR